VHLLYLLNECGRILNACEVGVFRGGFSREILGRIHSLEKLYLVDAWEGLINYEDMCNGSNKEMNEHFDKTLDNVSKWKDKVEILRGYSTEVCFSIADGSLDWVYIDARHDYLGCRDDIEAYWPKLKRGGIMSGHDYMENHELKRLQPQSDWSICYDGSFHPGAVKAAVDEFAFKNNLQVLVGYKEPDYPTWSILKL
jgi:hypothetical protein